MFELACFVCLLLLNKKEGDLDGAGRRGAMSVSRIYTFK